MLDDRYAKQKFWEAAEALIGPEPLQLRLRYAVLPLAVLRASSGSNQHLPPDIELRFNRLMDALTAQSPEPGEAFPPIQVSDIEARKLAHEIFSIFVEVMDGQ